MLNRIEEMMDFLNELPEAKEGFSAKTMYETGMKFGLTCKEVKDNLLGKNRALARGKYPAIMPNIDFSKLPEPKVKKAAAKAPAKGKKVAKRNVSTAVVAKTEAKDEAKLAERRELIKSIAKRHKAEDATVAELSKGNSNGAVENDAAVIEELERLTKASTVNPLSA